MLLCLFYIISDHKTPHKTEGNAGKNYNMGLTILIRISSLNGHWKNIGLVFLFCGISLFVCFVLFLLLFMTLSMPFM